MERAANSSDAPSVSTPHHSVHSSSTSSALSIVANPVPDAHPAAIAYSNLLAEDDVVIKLKTPAEKKVAAVLSGILIGAGIISVLGLTLATPAGWALLGLGIVGLVAVSALVYSERHNKEGMKSILGYAGLGAIIGASTVFAAAGAAGATGALVAGLWYCSSLSLSYLL
jgi:hypothetical protein